MSRFRRHRVSASVSSGLIALAVGALVLVLAIAANGCGEGGAADDATDEAASAAGPQIGLPLVSGSLEKDKYLAEANEICRESWADMVKKFARYRRQQRPNADEARTFAYLSKSIFLPHMQFWYDDISYLGVPQGGDKEQLEDVLLALQVAIVVGEERRIPTPHLYEAIFSSYSRLASNSGLDACVVDPEAFRRPPEVPSSSGR